MSKWLRWSILGLLFCASVLNYIDRQSLSMLARTIQNDLGITDIGYAQVVELFLLAYMLSFLVAGYITDRLGIRLSVALFIIWWSLSNVATGLVKSLGGLGLARFCLGAGESGLYVAAPKLVARHFPASQRGLAVGIYSAGATIGATIAPPLLAWLAIRFGWRSAFVAGGCLGLIWVVPWLLVYRIPKAREAEYTIDAAPLAAASSEPTEWRWWHVFRSRAVILLLLVRAVTDPVWQFILFWFSKYLTDAHHMSLAQVGRIAWVPYLAADIGGILGGYASGVLVKRGFRAPDARKWVMAACAIIIPCSCLLVTQIRSDEVVVMLMGVIAFAAFTWMVTVTALAVDVLPVERFGQIFGLIAAGSGLGGIVFANVVGHLVTLFSYTPVLVLMAALDPLGLILVWWIARSSQAPAPEAVLVER